MRGSAIRLPTPPRRRFAPQDLGALELEPCASLPGVKAWAVLLDLRLSTPNVASVLYARLGVQRRGAERGVA